MNDLLRHFNPDIRKTLVQERQRELSRAKLIIGLADNAIKTRPMMHGNIISAFLEEKAEPHIQNAEEITHLLEIIDENTKKH